MSDSILPIIQSRTKLFLSGPFGAGKTSLAIARVRWLLRQERVRGDDILVLVPQRTLAEPYYQALYGPGTPPGPPVRIATFASLAQQSTQLYWPLLAQTAGFADPAREPAFLNLETSQYHMSELVDNAIEQAEFDAIRLDRNRIISQVLDNLNKAALLRTSIDDVYTRLELAVPAGEQRTARLNALRAAQRISHAFRQLCLRETLLDFSLQVVLFNEHILTNDWSRTHLFRAHRHLVIDNVEENTPSAHALAAQWLPRLESALLIADEDAGYRSFLGADPEGAAQLAAACAEQRRVDRSYVVTPALENLARRVNRQIGGRSREALPAESSELPTANEEPADGLHDSQFTNHNSQLPFLIIPTGTFRFYPQMLQWTANEIRRLVVDDGVAPGEIAVLAPFVSDALRFSLQTTLAGYDIALTTHRPSRALEAEPAARTLFTLSKLAHPHWGLLPAPADVAQTLALSIPRLDPVRAHLLTEIVYPPRRRANELGKFATLAEPMRTRITYTGGEEYDRLREWIYTYRAAGENLPLDQFFARLFGELLSQPGYGFHENRDAARVASQLVDSSRKFRWALEELDAPGIFGDRTSGARGSGTDGHASPRILGRAYLRLAEAGAIAALYAPGWRVVDDAVFLAPAYTFLLRNRPVDVQFWLDIGAGGWWERLNQPLTHPFVLSPRWPATEPWTDADEFRTRQETMRRLLLGLIRRTRRQIYLGVSDYSESGFEQHGPLLNLVNRLLVAR